MVTLPQDIIEKFGLKPSTIHHAESFVNNIQFYEWPEYGYMARCDGGGKPLPKNQVGLFFNKLREGFAKCSIEALRNVPIDILVKSILE